MNNEQNKSKLLIIGIIALIIIVLALGSWYVVRAPLRDGAKDDSNASTTVDGRVRGPAEVALSEGQSADAAGLMLTMNKFVQDDRCATDDKCAEYGSVTVNLTLQNGDSVETRNIAMDEVPSEFAGYAISIIRVQPDRMFGKDIADNEYVITFRVVPTAIGDNY